MKIFAPFFFMAFFLLPLSAQESKPHDFRVGLIFQRSHYLYLENGIGFDYSNERLLQKQLHLILFNSVRFKYTLILKLRQQLWLTVSTMP